MMQTKTAPEKTPSAEAFKTWQSETTVSRLLAGLALVSFCCLTFYIFFTYRVTFHSDSAMKNLLAGEMVRTRQIFPSSWVYINDIPILFPHLFIVPLLAFFPNSFALHAVACFLSTIALAAALYLLFWSGRAGRSPFLLVSAVLFSGLSDWISENVFGQFAYGASVGATFVVLALLFLTVRAYTERQKPHVYIYSGLLFGLLTILIASGRRGLLVYAFPSIVALLSLSAVRSDSDSVGLSHWKARSWTTAVLIAGVVAGLLSFAAISRHIDLRNDKSAPAFVEYDGIKANVNTLIHGYLMFTGEAPDTSRAPVSLYGMMIGYRLVWFSVILLVPLYYVVYIRSICNVHFRFLLIYYWAGLAATLYLYVFSTLPAGQLPTFRYFTVPLVLALVLCGFALAEQRERRNKWLAIAAVASFPIYAEGCYELVAPLFNVSSTKGTTSVKIAANPHQGIADFLVRRNLRYGYSGYWDAGVISVLSSGRVRVNAVLPDSSLGLTPFLWLSSHDWYRPEAFKGPTFILFTESDYAGANKGLLETHLGAPAAIYSSDGYRVLVYNFNIAERYPDWGTSFSVNELYSLDDLKARVSEEGGPLFEKPGEQRIMKVLVTNLGSRSLGSAGAHPIYLGVHLYTSDSALKDFNYVLTTVPGEIKPGQTTEAPVTLKPLPEGDYILEVGLVQGGVAWFGSRADGQPLRVKLKVAQP